MHGKGFIVRHLRLVIVSLIVCGLLAGIILNSLWRFMPEFHDLDTIFSVPLYVQVIFLILNIALGVLLCRNNTSLKSSLVYILTIGLCIASWYQVVLSNRLNSFTISLYPFYHSEIKFDVIEAIKVEGNMVILITKSETKIQTIYTGLYPLGLNQNELQTTLASYGNCAQKEAEQCKEFEFHWP